jgi:hypothetical protein
MVIMDYFSYKNGPIDLVRGLFSSLDIGTYIPPTCRPLSTFMGSFGGAQMPLNSLNIYLWLFWTFSPKRMGLLIWYGARFQAQTLGHTSSPLAGLCGPFWVHLGMPKCPKQHKKLIFCLLQTTSS